MKDWSDLSNPMEDRNRTCLKNYDDQDKWCIKEDENRKIKPMKSPLKSGSAQVMWEYARWQSFW